MTSATDELRRLLDERGVEHESTEWIDGVTVSWQDGDGTAYCARDSLSIGGPTGTLDVYRLTPEQAIDATLGRGTCENTEQLPLAWSFTCSECGVHSITEGERFNYCPNCGRKVVE